jgi:hypothetical protein
LLTVEPLKDEGISGAEFSTPWPRQIWMAGVLPREAPSEPQLLQLGKKRVSTRISHPLMCCEVRGWRTLLSDNFTLLTSHSFLDPLRPDFESQQTPPSHRVQRSLSSLHCTYTCVALRVIIPLCHLPQLLSQPFVLAPALLSSLTHFLPG